MVIVMSNSNKLLYKQIMQTFENLIISKQLLSGEQIPTESELSEKYKVSRITAIRAVKELEMLGLVSRTKGKGTFVNDPAAWKINQENSAQFTEGTTAIQLLSLVLPYDEHFGYQILQGVERKAKEKGYYVTFHNSSQSVTKEREIVSKLIKDGVKGMIVYPVQSGSNIDMFANMLIKKIPFVVLDRNLSGLQVPHVVSDHFKGMYEMVRYLLKLGHQDIAFVSQSRTEAASVMERFKGYCQALIEASVTLDQRYIVDTTAFHRLRADEKDNSDEEITMRALRELMLLPQPPTAIVAVNDLTALHLIRNATLMGINVPTELSITGFDNLFIGEHVEVPLTTVEQSFVALGEEAADMIMNQILNGIDPSQKVVLPTRLVIRGSSSSPS